MTRIAVPRDAQELADELAIRELATRYAEAVIDYDEKAWGALWTEDGRWEVMGRVSEGREATVALWKELMATLEGVIQIPHSGRVELNGDTATGRWTISEHGRMQGGQPMLLMAAYYDRYRREPDGWRISERRLQPLYAGPPDLTGDLLPGR